ncbi:hypothetical protein BKP45_10620 [Anaerobacillus alkalidiazotrophicus]|uniref:DNA-binding response regulator n=1 Tax=Anaerobacillus alkalidiazotrophicus TaxID=472963 RepID=A0A1S2M4I3_9BACI|nr:response regulator transcription factor [Anaerobacillus alkalidiazotrophicus]OIJ18047.1 hypothetical protein BKP45_16335 [Anaerobacillus alkalidiazotrophicus]OIJ19526.1 hypothetical protein BKP45_10620 [Anaerobacillus alkalidiazotrophicus]
MINILIVDDHSIVGEGTKTILSSETDFNVEFHGSSLEIMSLLKVKKHDVYLIDFEMPELNGLELTKEILNVHQDAKIIIFTGYEITCYFNHLVEVGVSAFISKSSSKEQLIRTIRDVINHQSVIPTEILHQLRRTESKLCFENGTKISFSLKEEEIVIKISKGLTNEQIAKELFTSSRTVERHLREIFKKLNVSSRVDVVEKGRKLGLIPEVLI